MDKFNQRMQMFLRSNDKLYKREMVVRKIMTFFGKKEQNPSDAQGHQHTHTHTQNEKNLFTNE